MRLLELVVFKLAIISLVTSVFRSKVLAKFLLLWRRLLQIVLLFTIDRVASVFKGSLLVIGFIISCLLTKISYT